MEDEELAKLKCGTCKRYYELTNHICPITGWAVEKTLSGCISHTKVLETLYGNDNN